MTATNLVRARLLWDEDVSASQIAHRIGKGCTKSALIGYAHRQGWPPRPSPIVRNGVKATEPAPRVAPRPHHKPPEPDSTRKVRKVVRAIPTPPKAPPEPPPRFRHCQWPEGEDRRSWRFCDAPTAKNSAYCPTHHARCYHRYAPQRLEAA
jgi:hypothetical protein